MVTSSRIFSENLKFHCCRYILCFFRHSSSSAPSLSRPIFLNGHNPVNFLDDRRRHERPFSSNDLSRGNTTFGSDDATNVGKVFDEMPNRDGWMAESYRYVIEILRSALTTRANAETVRRCHCFALKIGFVEYLPASSMLLTLYARSGDLSSSLALFGELNVKDVILCNSMISVLVQNGRFSAALGSLVDMIEKGNEFDSTTLLLAASVLSNLGCSKQGRSVHGLAIKTGLLSDPRLCNALMKFYAKGRDLNSAMLAFAHTEHRDIVSWNTIMSGCLANHQPVKSLEYFKRMIRLGQAPDHVSLSSAISASACLEELGYGESLHGLAVKCGYSTDFHVSVANSIISMYSKCGDMEAASSVFEEISWKDVVSWNAMLNGFASNGMMMFHEAFDTLREMQLVDSIRPDIATAIMTLNLCAETVSSRDGRAVHGYVVRNEMQSRALSVTNSLIDMYGKCGLVRQAELMFRTASELDLVSWNSMISAYSLNEFSPEAKGLFKELLWSCSSSSQFSLSTVLAILPSCDSSNSLVFGRSIHSWQLKLGFGDNILSANSLTNMYISCGDLDAASLLAESVSETRDVTSWNTVIYGCASKGHYLWSLKAFQVMREEGKVLHDLVTLQGTISACGNLGLALQGRYLHGLAVKTVEESDTQLQNTLITMYGRCRDIESAGRIFGSVSDPNLCSWNSMISALSQNKAGQQAFELFRDITFNPNEITLVSLLSASSTYLGFGSYGVQIHSYLIRHGFQDNPFVIAALLDTYSNCGKLETCMKVFRNSKVKSLAVWNSVISAYGFHGKGEKAMEMFSEATNSGMKPNKSTFISLLSACSHSGLIDEGIRYYNQMEEEFGVIPVTEHQVCVVDMLGRAGRIREAYRFVRGIGEEPEAGVWGALLSACNYHGEIELGKEVGEVLFEMEPENAGYYISLSNAYVGAGRWQEAVLLRRLVEERALTKLPGRSVTDVGFR